MLENTNMFNKSKPYHPPKLPVTVDKSLIADTLGDASFELGKLDGLQRNLQNPALLVSPLTVKEATVSSKIEGTKSTVSEVMMFEASQKAEREDTVEVANYRKAILIASEQIRKQKLSLSFMKTLHSILLENVRGHEKRGDFRKGQVYVGPKNAKNISEATYIPPEHYLVPEYMENLESYILKHEQNHLIKAAILHYQFEAIHPFGDGNGRIGRLIIPLYLFSEGKLHQPILYLSGYFDKNRDEYISTLHLVDETQKYEHWVNFFLKAVIAQAKETQDLIYKINTLRAEVGDVMADFKSPYLDRSIDFLFKKPVFRNKDLREVLKIGRTTGYRIISKFTEKGMVVKIQTKLVKGDIYIFNKLTELL